MSRDLIIVLIVQEVEDYVENEGHYYLQRLVSVKMLEQFQVVSSEEGLSDLEELEFKRISLLNTQQLWVGNLKSDCGQQITCIFNYMSGDELLDIIPFDQILYVSLFTLLGLFKSGEELTY